VLPASGRYCRTNTYYALRICERYGQDPLTWPQKLDRGAFAVLIAQELVRDEEEHADLLARMRAE